MRTSNSNFLHPKNYLYSKPVKGLRGYGAGYCFSFNGQEKDDEVSGVGNTMTAEFWEYDSRLGRRWNIDNVVKHWESGYATFSNNPMFFVDPNGNTAGDYYAKDGTHLGNDGNNDDKAYVVSGFCENTDVKKVNLSQDALKTIGNGTHPTLVGTDIGVTNSKLLEGAAMAYNEGEKTFEGRNAIVNVLLHREKEGGSWGKTFDEVMGNLAGNGVGKTHEKRMDESLFARYATFFNKGSEGRNKDATMQDCISASLHAMMGGKDYSCGAMYWHGNDFFLSGWYANDNERVPKGFEWTKDATITGTLKSYMKNDNIGTTTKSSNYKGLGYYGKNVFMIYKPKL